MHTHGDLSACVAVNQRREGVMVAEGGDCVSVFRPRGQKLLSFGTCVSGHGQFRDPGGVAVEVDRCRANIG